MLIIIIVVVVIIIFMNILLGLVVPGGPEVVVTFCGEAVIDGPLLGEVEEGGGLGLVLLPVSKEVSVLKNSY